MLKKISLHELFIRALILVSQIGLLFFSGHHLVKFVETPEVNSLIYGIGSLALFTGYCYYWSINSGVLVFVTGLSIFLSFSLLHLVLPFFEITVSRMPLGFCIAVIMGWILYEILEYFTRRRKK